MAIGSQLLSWMFPCNGVVVLQEMVYSAPMLDVCYFESFGNLFSLGINSGGGAPRTNCLSERTSN